MKIPEDAKVRRMGPPVYKEHVRPPRRNRVDDTWIVDSPEVMCPRVFRLVQQERRVVAVQQWNVPGDRSAELPIRFYRGAFPLVKNLHFEIGVAGKTRERRGVVLNRVCRQ